MDAIPLYKRIKTEVIEDGGLRFIKDGREILIEITDYENRGGEGSGNFGHAGRPGKIGGSAKGTGGKHNISSKNNTISKQKDHIHSKSSVIKNKAPNIKAEVISVEEFSSKAQNEMFASGLYTSEFVKEGNVTSLKPKIYIRGDIPSGETALGEDVFIVSGGTNGVFRHEYGHFVYDHVLTNQQRKDFESLHIKEKDGMWDNVSRYSASNPREGFAEIFNARFHPEYGKTYSLPTNLENYLNSTLELD